MSPGSGYGIHKVVDMMNSDWLRDLAQDAKRASVLMALDAAGISADDLLTDATRRQNALTSYESSQVKQLEDFEERKAKENSKIEEEMEKIRMHYAQRVQTNLDLVTKEKDALRNWQMAMQHETQRIAEVIELCGKQPAPKANAMAAAAGAQGAEKPEASAAQPGGTVPVRPTLNGH
jgi:ClpP class serine protease